MEESKSESFDDVEVSIDYNRDLVDRLPSEEAAMVKDRLREVAARQILEELPEDRSKIDNRITSVDIPAVEEFIQPIYSSGYVDAEFNAIDKLLEMAVGDEIDVEYNISHFDTVSTTCDNCESEVEDKLYGRVKYVTCDTCSSYTSFSYK